MAVVVKTRAETVPYMVAHMHTVFKLYHKAPQSAAWLEYDVQFHMEAAALDDKVWSCGAVETPASTSPASQAKSQRVIRLGISVPHSCRGHHRRKTHWGRMAKAASWLIQRNGQYQRVANPL